MKETRTEPAVEPAEPVRSQQVAPLARAQAPLAEAKGGKGTIPTGRVPPYDASDPFGLVVAVKWSIGTARKDLVTRINQLASETKDKNKGSQNTVSEAEYSALETKLNLAKGAIQKSRC